MENQFQREIMAFGEEALEKLSKSHVAIFGLGGVGGYCTEALARSGVGEFSLIDNDTFSITNLNRQLYATHSTIGMDKCEVSKQRILDINPNCKVHTYKLFYLPETENDIDLSTFDYIVDAIDTMSGKIHLVVKAKALNIPIISSMGAGNKVDGTKVEVGDIYKTSVDPLAKIMRRELKKRNIDNLKVVFSTEEPLTPNIQDIDLNPGKRTCPSSSAFVPSVFGLVLAGEVVLDLINYRKK